MSYPSPVDKLLTHEKPQGNREWPDYSDNFGLDSEHVHDLIRMTLDEDLLWADPDSLEVWAPIHAWRALGQLHAEAAIEPLTRLFDDLQDSDWAWEELPIVYSMIGPAAIPELKAYLAQNARDDEGSLTATDCLKEIATRHPEARDMCVTALAHQLKRFSKNHPILNALIVTTLSDLKAVEAAPTIERAFAAGRVDEFMAGEWDDLQIEMGLKEPDEEWRKREEMTKAVAEAMAEGKPLPFSIYQRVFWGDEYMEAQAEEYREQLIDLFGKSPEGQALLQEGIQLHWADTMLEFAIGHLGVMPPKVTPADLREIVFELIPRKVVTEPDSAPEVIQELRGFWTFAGREFGLRNAPACLKALDDRATRRLEKALGDPASFGMAKSLVTMGVARGFDMSTPEGMQEWVDTYNAEIAAGTGSPVPLPGERGKSATKSRKKMKRKMQKSSRKKNRKKK
jgi:hypothetical protein